jgi:ParB-like chromosome segregation protein Spo0J
MPTATKKKPKTPAREPSGSAAGSTSAAKDLAHITPALRPLAVPIDSLKLDPHNARLHPEKNKTALALSLSKFGQQKPIVADGDGIILAGNGTYAEALSLGWVFIAAIRTDLTGAAAKAWAIADNRTAELAEWDVEELDRQLDELDEEFKDTDLGFDEKQVDALLNGEFEDAHGFAPKREKPAADKPAGEEKIAAQFKIIINCRDEKDQRELIEEFEKRGYEFTAPNVT